MKRSPIRERSCARSRAAASAAPARGWRPPRAPRPPGSARPCRRRGSAARRSRSADRRPTASGSRRAARPTPRVSRAHAGERRPSAPTRRRPPRVQPDRPLDPVVARRLEPGGELEDVVDVDHRLAAQHPQRVDERARRERPVVGRDARPAAPASSAAPLIAPADAPRRGRSTAVSPSRSIAAVIAADTTPRIPPPSSTRATRWPSPRSPGPGPVRARSSRTCVTGCVAGWTAAAGALVVIAATVAPPTARRGPPRTGGREARRSGIHARTDKGVRREHRHAAVPRPGKPDPRDARPRRASAAPSCSSVSPSWWARTRSRASRRAPASSSPPSSAPRSPAGAACRTTSRRPPPPGTRSASWAPWPPPAC